MQGLLMPDTLCRLQGEMTLGDCPSWSTKDTDKNFLPVSGQTLQFQCIFCLQYLYLQFSFWKLSGFLGWLYQKQESKLSTWDLSVASWGGLYYRLIGGRLENQPPSFGVQTTIQSFCSEFFIWVRLKSLLFRTAKIKVCLASSLPNFLLSYLSLAASLKIALQMERYYIR